MSDQMKQIAQRIRTLREISDYTVAEVAGFTGLSDADYESYESGVVDIPISLLLKLSQLFKVDTTTILTGDMPRLNVCAVTRKVVTPMIWAFTLWPRLWVMSWRPSLNKTLQSSVEQNFSPIRLKR